MNQKESNEAIEPTDPEASHIDSPVSALSGPSFSSSFFPFSSPSPTSASPANARALAIARPQNSPTGLNAYKLSPTLSSSLFHPSAENSSLRRVFSSPALPLPSSGPASPAVPRECWLYFLQYLLFDLSRRLALLPPLSVPAGRSPSDLSGFHENMEAANKFYLRRSEYFQQKLCRRVRILNESLADACQAIAGAYRMELENPHGPSKGTKNRTGQGGGEGQQNTGKQENLTTTDFSPQSPRAPPGFSFVLVFPWPPSRNATAPAPSRHCVPSSLLLPLDSLLNWVNWIPACRKPTLEFAQQKLQSHENHHPHHHPPPHRRSSDSPENPALVHGFPLPFGISAAELTENSTFAGLEARFHALESELRDFLSQVESRVLQGHSSRTQNSLAFSHSRSRSSGVSPSGRSISVPGLLGTGHSSLAISSISSLSPVSPVVFASSTASIELMENSTQTEQYSQ